MSLAIDLAILWICYIIGAIPTGLLVARRLGGIDIREHGSKNIGMTNVWRVLGWKAGLTTLLIDVVKAMLAVLWLPLQGGEAIPALAVFAGLAVLIGNFFNVFLNFKGGKGVATSLGVFLALAPEAILCVFVLFVLIVAITGYISLGSLIGAILFPVAVYYFQGTGPVLYMVVIVSLLIIYKHRANIGRLMNGTESKFSLKKKAQT